MGKKLEQAFLYTIQYILYTKSQHAHEMTFDSTNNQGNTSQNQNEILLHTHQDGRKKERQKDKKKDRQTEM